MSWRPSLTLALIWFAIRPLGADTITTTDRASVNGSLTTLANGEITFVARYVAEDKTLLIKLKDTDVIEFNANKQNFGSPPTAATFGPSRASESKTHLPQPQEDAGKIILRGDQRKPCTLVAIDTQFVHCEGKDGDYNRKIVIRVVVGAE